MNQVEFKNVTRTVLPSVSVLGFKNLFTVCDFVPNRTLGTRTNVRHESLDHLLVLCNSCQFSHLQDTSSTGVFVSGVPERSFRTVSETIETDMPASVNQPLDEPAYVSVSPLSQRD